MPLHAEFRFIFKRPKKTKLSHPHPDLDNLVKAVADAANEICYRDDTQLVQLTASKAWGDEDQIVMILWSA